MNQKRFERKPNLVRSPKIVGAARNAFGTRLCERVECSRCHKVDYVSFKVSSAKTKYCRTCAEKLLETYECGRHVEQKRLKLPCQQCRTEFSVSEAVAQKKQDLLCPDCLRGFETWRGKVTDGDAHKSTHLIKRNSTVVLRKFTHDTI